MTLPPQSFRYFQSPTIGGPPPPLLPASNIPCVPVGLGGKAFLSRREVADLLGVTYITVQAYEKAGKLRPSVTCGKTSHSFSDLQATFRAAIKAGLMASALNPKSRRKVSKRAAAERLAAVCLEKEGVETALRASSGRRAKAAAMLGIHPNTLGNKLRKWPDLASVGKPVKPLQRISPAHGG